MRKLMLAFAILAVALAITGCSWVSDLFGRGEAEIVSFSLGDIQATITIDPEARTVVIEAPPVNLNSLAPEVEVSEGAELSSAPEFKDGEAVIYEVTAKNGDVVEWQITINLRLGISFRLGGELIILEEGFTNSGSAAAADDWGNGEPGGSVSTGGPLTAVVVRTLYDWYTTVDEPPEYVWLDVDSPDLGTYTDFAFDFNYNLDEFDDGSYEMRFLQDSGTLVITSTGEQGSVIAGVFEAQGSNDMNASPASVTNGFFKVLRIADDMWMMAD